MHLLLFICLLECFPIDILTEAEKKIDFKLKVVLQKRKPEHHDKMVNVDELIHYIKSKEPRVKIEVKGKEIKSREHFEKMMDEVDERCKKEPFYMCLFKPSKQLCDSRRTKPDITKMSLWFNEMTFL